MVEVLYMRAECIGWYFLSWVRGLFRGRWWLCRHSVCVCVCGDVVYGAIFRGLDEIWVIRML